MVDKNRNIYAFLVGLWYSIFSFRCSVDHYLTLCPFPFGHCIVCPLMYGFRLPLWYLQLWLAVLASYKTSTEASIENLEGTKVNRINGMKELQCVRVLYEWMIGLIAFCSSPLKQAIKKRHISTFTVYDFSTIVRFDFGTAWMMGNTFVTNYYRFGMCSVCRDHSLVLSSFMTWHLLCNNNNTMGVNSGPGTAYPSGISTKAGNQEETYFYFYCVWLMC
jgi:hypothetical protein